MGGSLVVTPMLLGFSYSVAYGIFQDQGLNPCLPPWQADSSPLTGFIFLDAFLSWGAAGQLRAMNCCCSSRHRSTAEAGIVGEESTLTMIGKQKLPQKTQHIYALISQMYVSLTTEDPGR